jgi:cell fate (sporulation/competence/biofilm development) regulator YlbF (YheA/YmcA/DUF963 family)
MKTYKNISDCIHSFAQQDQTSGKSSNVFFEYKKLYSYGYHFTLAEFLTENIILLDDTQYSSTTRKHQNITRYATKQYIQLYTSTYHIQNCIRDLKELQNKLAKAKKPEKYIELAQRIINDHKEGQKFFADNSEYYHIAYKEFKELEKFFSTVINSDKLKAYKEKLKKLQSINLHQYKEAFKSYESYTNFKNLCKSKIDYIRLSICGNYIETTQNVTIPLYEALRVYKALNMGIDIRGEKIQNYIVRDVTDSQIKIGCHILERNDIIETFNKLEA